MKAVLPTLARPLIEAALPADLEVHWFSQPEEALRSVADADIAWLDSQPLDMVTECVRRAERLKWLFTIVAGIDFLDLDLLRERGTILTNGTGINALAVAEYAVLGMLVAAKRYDEVVRIADRYEWTETAPGHLWLDGSQALIIGQGAIGSLIAERLTAFAVAVTGVTRSGRDGTLKPDQWRQRLGEFDWVVLTAPSTGETRAMIGAAELAAMRPTAWLVNVGRGDLVDQDALIEALNAGRIAGAFLDTVSPEPLPSDHPLWRAKNRLMTMHLSGRSQTGIFARAAKVFLYNLDAFLNHRPMRNVADLRIGY